jgi:hypothetical protein
MMQETIEALQERNRELETSIANLRAFLADDLAIAKKQRHPDTCNQYWLDLGKRGIDDTCQCGLSARVWVLSRLLGGMPNHLSDTTPDAETSYSLAITDQDLLNAYHAQTKRIADLERQLNSLGSDAIKCPTCSGESRIFKDVE